VQTFLPYPSFADSAAALDPMRLGKQRVETLQLLRANTVPDYGWRHHPAAKMWAGRLPALVAYGLAMTDAWTALGHADTVRGQLLEFAPEVDGVPQELLELPRWLGDPALHLSHRSNLVRKDPAFYRPRFGDVPDDLPYVWPKP
jgi:Pyrimidine dimer DNA glycosylase